MKKTFLLGIAAIPILTACSQDELISTNNDLVIGFNSTYVGKVTRATEITTNDLKAFDVFGYRGTETIFNQEHVIGSKANGFTYTNIQYWTNDKFYFTAIAPTTEDREIAGWTFAAGSDDDKSKGVISFDNSSTSANGENDLIAANTSRDNSSSLDASQVTLSFGHLLSRVAFKFYNTFENNNVVIRKLEITNATANGDYNLATPAWENLSGTETYSFLPSEEWAIEKATTQSNGLTSDSKFLIPNAATAYNINLTCDLMNGDEVLKIYEFTDLTVTIDGMTAGNSYLITAGFNDTLIKSNKIAFSVTRVVPWDENTTPTEESLGETVIPSIDASKIIGTNTVTILEEDNDDNEGVKESEFSEYDKIYLLQWDKSDWSQCQTFFREVSTGVYELTIGNPISEFRIICADQYGSEKTISSDVWKFAANLYGEDTKISPGNAYYLYARKQKIDGNLPYVFYDETFVNVKLTFVPSMRLLVVDQITEEEVQEERIVKYSSSGAFVSDSANILTE